MRMHNKVDAWNTRLKQKVIAHSHTLNSFHQIYFNCIFSVYQFILESKFFATVICGWFPPAKYRVGPLFLFAYYLVRLKFEFINYTI